MIKRLLENGDYINKKIGIGDYNFFSIKNFFGFNDGIRFIKMINIFLSFILNLLIIISILKRKKQQYSIAFNLTGNILIINFIHTLTYILNWVTNIDNAYEFTDKNNNNTYKVGGLLIGSPKNNMSVCRIQGFLLVYSSLSQDISIIIFFYIINKTSIPSKFNILIKLIIFAHFLPFLLGVIYSLIGGIGLNDRYCYIKKFGFKEKANGDNYYIYDNFRALIITTYTFRGINLGISIYLLIKIIKYIKKQHLTRLYILKTSSILIVQVITITIGFIYRLSHIISNKNNKIFSDIFLCINTLDGILFPLSYSLSNGIYQNLCYSHKFNESLDSLMIDDELKDNRSSSSHSSSHKNNTFAMIDIKDENNFDLSYI
jgi:hypothetical protein